MCFFRSFFYSKVFVSYILSCWKGPHASTWAIHPHILYFFLTFEWKQPAKRINKIFLHLRQQWMSEDWREGENRSVCVWCVQFMSEDCTSRSESSTDTHKNEQQHTEKEVWKKLQKRRRKEAEKILSLHFNSKILCCCCFCCTLLLVNNIHTYNSFIHTRAHMVHILHFFASLRPRVCVFCVLIFRVLCLC